MRSTRTGARPTCTAFAWRIPFLLGGVFGFFAVFLRRWLPRRRCSRKCARRALAAGLPLRVVLRGHGRAVVVSMLLTWMLTAAIVVVILMTPTLIQKQFHIAPATALVANSRATLRLADRLHRWRVRSPAASARARRFSVGGVALAISLLRCCSANCRRHRGAACRCMRSPASPSAWSASIPFVMVRAFPAAVRFSGISFSYNVAYAMFGGLTPIVVSLMMKSSPHGAGALCRALCVVGIACTPFIRTKPRDVALN